MDSPAYDIDARMRLQVLEWVATLEDAGSLLADDRIATPTLEGRRGIAWNAHATMLNALVERLGEQQVVDGIADGLFRSDDFSSSMQALGTLASPAAAFRFSMGMASRMNPGLDHELAWSAADRVVLTLARGAPDSIRCPSYFGITARVIEVLPETLLGTRSAHVRYTTDGLQGRFDIQLPPARTWWSRLRNAVDALRGRDRMGALMFEEQVHARERMLEMQALASALDSRVAERTAEVEALNERLRKASANKSRHLADMSHELRTPLNAIIGYAEMLAEDRTDPGDREDLQRIERSAHYLLGLIDNVLDLSKIEAGQLEIDVGSHALGPLVDDLLEGLVPVVSSGGNRLEREGDEAVASVDPMRFQQILVNLVGNAAKFTRDGVITVAMVVESDEAVVRVSDTGRGMDASTLARVFEPYAQADESADTPFKGTGLGLPIARELAHRMGGTLAATSRRGEGSVFELRLPISPGRRGGPAGSAAPRT